MNAAEGGPKRAAGQIKWFDPVKGFGFILDDGGGPDILLHANVLRSFGQSSIAEGSRVEVEVTPTARGLQASAILALSPPADDRARPVAEVAAGDPASLAALPFLPARVKWFDKAKGFGFATVFGQSADVFLHFEVLRHGGFADLASGEAVALRVMKGGRGLMAVQVAGWDRGIPRADAQGEGQANGSGAADPGAGPAADASADRSEGAAAAPPAALDAQPCGVAAVPAPPPPSPVGADAVAMAPPVAAGSS